MEFYTNSLRRNYLQNITPKQFFYNAVFNKISFTISFTVLTDAKSLKFVQKKRHEPGNS